MSETESTGQDPEAIKDPVQDLPYEPIEARYRTLQIVTVLITYVILGAVALLLLLLDNCIWCILAECVIAVALIINLFIVRKAWLFKGYRLSGYDISYRSGILFPSVTTIPFNRLQQVSIKQNPVSKLLHLYAVEVVNGAQGLASMTIPGLSEENAEHIKGTLVEKLKDEQE